MEMCHILCHHLRHKKVIKETACLLILTEVELKSQWIHSYVH